MMNARLSGKLFVKGKKSVARMLAKETAKEGHPTIGLLAVQPLSHLHMAIDL